MLFDIISCTLPLLTNEGNKITATTAAINLSKLEIQRRYRGIKNDKRDNSADLSHNFSSISFFIVALFPTQSILYPESVLSCFHVELPAFLLTPVSQRARVCVCVFSVSSFVLDVYKIFAVLPLYFTKASIFHEECIRSIRLENLFFSISYTLLQF